MHNIRNRHTVYHKWRLSDCFRWEYRHIDQTCFFCIFPSGWYTRAPRVHLSYTSVCGTDCEVCDVFPSAPRYHSRWYYNVSQIFIPVDNTYSFLFSYYCFCGNRFWKVPESPRKQTLYHKSQRQLYTTNTAITFNNNNEF